MTTGLRERKRLATMRRVQDTALDLFDQHGYGHVTVEQIADQAEVSPSSIYRYFNTKEGILLWNPHHEAAFGRFGVQREGSSLLSEFRRVTRELFLDETAGEEDWQRRRLRYLLDEPGLAASLGGQLMMVTQVVADVLAKRTERSSSEPVVQATAGALMGAFYGAIQSWRAQDYATSLGAILDETYDTLQDGLPLVTEIRVNRE